MHLFFNSAQLWGFVRKLLNLIEFSLDCIGFIMLGFLTIKFGVVFSVLRVIFFQNLFSLWTLKGCHSIFTGFTGFYWFFFIKAKQISASNLAS